MRATILKDLQTVFNNALATGQLKNMADARALCDLYSEVESSLYDLDTYETKRNVDLSNKHNTDAPDNCNTE
jgi:hypothetical protein